MAPLTFYEEFLILCWIVFYGYLLVSAFSVKRTVERSRRSGLSWRLPVILTLIIFVVIVRIGSLQGYISAEIWPQTLAVELIADALTVLGMAIAVWARRTLSSNWSAAVVFKENHNLITDGPYAYVRHPMYTGLLTMFLAVAILVGQVVGFIVFAIAVFGLLIKARSEENLMLKHFPKEYSKYKERTKMIIPFVF